MIKTYATNGEGPTEEQLKEVEEASKLPIRFDDECPELSAEMKQAFVEGRNRMKCARK